MKKTTVGNLGQIVTGHTPPRKQPDYYGTHIPFIKPTDINEHEKFTYAPEECYSLKGAEKYKSSLIPRGSTCVVTIGSIGKKMTMSHCDCFINQAMNAIIPNQYYDNEYVYYLLKYNLTKLKSLDSGTSSGRENVSKSSFSNMEILVHECRTTQQKIGGILSAYDDLIENNQKQIKLLEEAAMLLYKEWFVNFRFPGHEKTPIIDNVPQGWAIAQLKDVTTMIKRGISPKYNNQGKSMVINQKCIREFIVDYLNARRQEKDFPPDMNLADGDVVICSTGTGTLGRVGQIFGEINSCTFDSHVTIIRANNQIGQNYLGQALKTKQSYFESMGKGATNQTELSKSIVENLFILVPEMNVQNMFEDSIQALRMKMTCCKQTITTLQQCRNKLLPKLMSGEIQI